MDIRELKQERAGIVAQMQALHATAEGENRAQNAEEREKFDRLKADEASLRGRIDEAEALRNLSHMDIGSSASAGIRGRDLSDATVDQATRTDEYRSAFETYIRRGLIEMTSDERAALRAGEQRDTDMLVSAGTHGGYVVPTDFAKIVISKKVPAVAVRRTQATVFNTSNGQDLPVPVQSAYGAAAYLTEGSVEAATVADTGAKVTLKAFTIVRPTAVSFQLMDDSAFDISTLLAGNIAKSFALKEDPEFIVGVGSTAITGVAACTVGQTTGANSTPALTYSDITSWLYSVGPQYRPQGEFVLSDSAMPLLAGLVDDNHRPIWTAAQIPGEPDTLMGKPLYTSLGFAALAVSSVFGVFGDWANGYGIRDVGGVQVRRSDERRIDQLESLFMAWERVDGQQLDADALRSIKFGAAS